jgi:hypothetical protein
MKKPLLLGLTACMCMLAALACVACASAQKTLTAQYQTADISASQYSYIEQHWGSGAALSKGKMWLESQGVKFSPIAECSSAKLAALFTAHAAEAPSFNTESTSAQYYMGETETGGWFIAWLWKKK